MQQGKSVNRLNDSNVIELVTKLIEAGLVELIISGQGYLTPKQLEIEIKDEVLVHGGRVALTELQSTIGADSSIVDDAAGRLVAASPRSLALVQGELIADYFLDDVAAEVNQELQEVHPLVHASGLTRAMWLSAPPKLESEPERESMHEREGGDGD
eukprot:SAG11_NODE_247_length_11679_cov_6.170898_2_plen_156_part_00